ncbi:hypothetical protein I4U23_003778 [Adineta vaga]|nr:hypothetical protein I4U23_003778 [Adineta vaga]
MKLYVFADEHPRESEYLAKHATKQADEEHENDVARPISVIHTYINTTMTKLLLIIAIVLAVATVALSIDCYAGVPNAYLVKTGFDACYSWTIGNNILMKAGAKGATCASPPPGRTCLHDEPL